MIMSRSYSILFLFFNVRAPTEVYTLSLHDALPICRLGSALGGRFAAWEARSRRRGAHEKFSVDGEGAPAIPDRKSTRLNSSHTVISYAVFCLKKKRATNASGSCTQSPRWPRIRRQK